MNHYILQTHQECEICRKARGPSEYCNCCEEHGRQRYYFCNNCFDWVRARLTCPFHGDCC